MTQYNYFECPKCQDDKYPARKYRMVFVKPPLDATPALHKRGPEHPVPYSPIGHLNSRSAGKVSGLAVAAAANW